jgi:hypothetical protein
VNFKMMKFVPQGQQAIKEESGQADKSGGAMRFGSVPKFPELPCQNFRNPHAFHFHYGRVCLIVGGVSHRVLLRMIRAFLGSKCKCFGGLIGIKV